MERPGIRRCIFVIQVCILTIISSMFINFNISLEQTPMITLTNTQSIFNTYEIRVKSVIVDEKIFKPSDIFYGDYTIDGETILLNNGSTIEGQLPEGKSHKIVFETGTYRGNCIITVDGRSYEISTYSGYWDSVEHNLLQKHEITVKKVLQILIFATIIAFYYYISARYFGYMRENLITKCLMVISGTVATLIMASNTSVGLIMGISVVLSIPVHIILSENINKWVKNSKNLINYFSAFLTICLMITLIRGSYSYFSSLISVRNEYFNIIVSIIYLISLPFFYIAVNTLTNYIISKGMCSLKNTDTFERRFLISSLIIYIGIIVIVYFNSSAFTDGFYLNSLGQVSQRSADIIYGYDHSWIQAAVSELTIHNYDIRHPLLKWILIVPASAFQVVFSIFTPISKQFYGGALAIMSTVFMVFTAILLKRMTKCNWIAPIYASTYFFIIMCLGYEQYQLSVFLVAYASYLAIYKRENKAFAYGLLMSGSTLTSGHMVPLLFSFNGIIPYLKKIIKYCIIFLMLLCVTGSFPACIMDLSNIIQFTGVDGLGFTGRFKIFTHFVTWSFVSPQTSINHLGADAYAFTGVLPDTYSAIGIAILIICILSFMINKKDRVCQLSIWSVLFSFVLCAVMGWAISEAWLYVILFSWAYIVLIVKLVMKVIHSENMQKIVLSAMFAFVLCVNIKKLTEIIYFAVNYYSQIG